ncbi:Uncharacterised protein [Mycobacterium tuberculosis]|uniref:Uncharacterized protein n=1 Tax=Mycobacterium tuberculosis TaxID=1773 RepID=A0A916L7S1_MYCTX|nr:Uncharacterised protein [Mycobacterium tuberculosis]
MSISWVSAIPPMLDPARLRRMSASANAGTAMGCSGIPSSTSVPSTSSRFRYWPRSKLAETVFRIRSKPPRSLRKVSGSAVA